MATEADVFDALHRNFGIGDYDETSDKAPPWFRWRATQIRRIKALRIKRNTECWELMAAIDYCLAHGMYPVEHWEVYEAFPACLPWAREKAQAEADKDLADKITRATQIEAAADDPTWFDRLARASGPARAEVYREWLAR